MLVAGEYGIAEIIDLRTHQSVTTLMKPEEWDAKTKENEGVWEGQLKNQHPILDACVSPTGDRVSILAWRPAPREGARSARRLPPSQSLVNRRRPVLSVMVVASRPFDMVPDGLRAQSGQLFGGRGLLCGGRGARCAAEAGVEH